MSRLADDRGLCASDRRRLAPRTNEEGTCGWCGLTLGRWPYDGLWCSLECARRFASAAWRLGFRFKPMDERGGPLEVLRAEVAWVKDNPGGDADTQRERRAELERLERVLARWQDKEGS